MLSSSGRIRTLRDYTYDNKGMIKSTKDYHAFATSDWSQYTEKEYSYGRFSNVTSLTISKNGTQKEE